MGAKKVKKEDSSVGSFSKGSFHHTGVSTSTRLGTRIIASGEEENTMKMQIRKASEIPASLILLAGPHRFIGHSWVLDKSPITVGRSSRLSDIVILDNSISKTHLQIQRDGGKLYLTDLGSTNKTHLDNNLLVPYRKYLLKSKSQIRVGNAVFKFLEKGDLELFSNQEVLGRTHQDSLTKLYNRAALKIKGAEFFNSNKKFCVMALDIDHFKKINDTYGHLAGDFILKQLSKHITLLLREGDMAFRYGGEEFCIFTYNSPEVSQNIAERIRKEVKRQVFKFKDQEIRLTLSIGIASVKDSDKRWDDVYARADSFLYSAKTSGRDQVCFKND